MRRTSLTSISAVSIPSSAEDFAEQLSLDGTPYSFLPQSEQQRLFEGEPHKFIVEPKHIYKYRTNVVHRQLQLWEAKKKEIDNLLPRRANRRRRKTMLSALCRL